MLRFLALLVVLLASPALGQSQSVRQSGNITPRHASCWVATGVLGDCGTAASNSVTSFGTTGQGPTICVNSDVSTAAGYQRLCLGATTADGAQISVSNIGTATAMPLTFDINGTIVTVPASTGTNLVTGDAPFTTGVPTCWTGTGIIANCTAPAVTLVGNPTAASSTPSFFTINGLTQLNTPSASLDFLLIWDHTAGTFKKINPTTIAATNTAGVGTIGGLSGTVGLSTGLTTSANNVLIDNTVVREKVTSPMSIFVDDSLGVDSASCGLTTGAGACKTIQKAWDNMVLNYDNTSIITVQLAAGQTFTAGLTAFPYVGSGRVIFDGGTSTIHTTNIYAMQVAGAFPQRLTIQNTKFQTSTSGNCLQVILGGNVGWGSGNDMGACADSQLYVDSYGVLEGSDYTISGSARSAMRAIQGQISIQLATITIANTPAFSEGFAHASNLGLIYIPGNTYTGTVATGPRFAVDTLGFLYTLASCTALPGNAVGTNTTGGIADCSYNFYVPGSGLFGSTTISNPGILLTASNSNTGQIEVHANSSIANNVSMVLFVRNGSTIADIAYNSGTGGVNYNTTSDYRLKDGIAPVTNALEAISHLHPVSYWMKDSPGREKVQGFLAHELQKTLPWAVSGEKDAVDGDGNPIYQKVDLSKLTPLLAAGLQELEARVNKLESSQRRRQARH